MSHVICTNESCHIYQRVCHIYGWDMSHTRMSESCYTCFHETIRQWFTYTDESCHVYKWVMSYIWMSHVTHISINPFQPHRRLLLTYMNESCHIHERVMSHIQIYHVEYMNGSCHKTMHVSCHAHERNLSPMYHIYRRVMSRIRMCRVTHILMGHVAHITETISTAPAKMVHVHEWDMSPIE